MRTPSAFHARLHPFDTEKQTHGCRHTCPDICSKYHMAKVCSFARADNVCLAPPRSWPKQFEKLKDDMTKAHQPSQQDLGT